MSFQTIKIDFDGTAADFKSVCSLQAGGLDACQSLENFFGALCGGNQMAALDVNVGAEKATATLTVSAGGSTAAQAGTIANITLTGVAATPDENEFVVSATAATQAANMAAAINASSDLAGIVTAEADGGVVTLTAVTPGIVGNAIEISVGNLANVVAAGFTGGDNGTEYIVNLK